LSKSYRDIVYKYIKKEYDSDPEFPWEKYSGNAVFRHMDNKKWFALVMNVPKDKLGLEGTDEVDVMNVKLDDPIFMDMLLRQKGYNLKICI
jgi:Uncharacterized protein conserved in bacteria